MRKKHEFHKENCEIRIREVVKDMFGNTIVLSGQHAFEWSITVCSHGTYTKTTYKNSKEARKKFRKYKTSTKLSIGLCIANTTVRENSSV